MLRLCLFLALIFLLLNACDQRRQQIPDPDYNPHLLKPGKFIPAKGKRVSLDSMAKPTYVPAKGEYIQVGKSQFVPLASNKPTVRKPVYIPVKGKRINRDSVSKPESVPALGKKASAY